MLIIAAIVYDLDKKQADNGKKTLEIDLLTDNRKPINKTFYNKYYIINDIFSQSLSYRVEVDGQTVGHLTKGDYLIQNFKYEQNANVCFVDSSEVKKCKIVTLSNTNETNLVRMYSNKEEQNIELITSLSRYKNFELFLNGDNSLFRCETSSNKKLHFKSDSTTLYFTKTDKSIEGQTLIWINGLRTCRIQNGEYFTYTFGKLKEDPEICASFDGKKRCLKFKDDVNEKAVIFVEDEYQKFYPTFDNNKASVQKLEYRISKRELVPSECPK